MAIIQCPNCSKKLKLKAVPSGKKVRCPGCKEAFQPKAASSGAPPARKKVRKKPKPVDDDFVDFDDDGAYDDSGFEEEFDESPAPRKPKGKSRSKKKGGKPSKKKPAAKSKAPLFIGIGVLVAAAIGGGIFFAMSGGEDDGGTDIADTSTDTGTDPSTDTTDNQDNGTETEGTTSSAAPPVASNPVEVSGVNLQWLPGDSEVIAFIDVEKILSGPAGNVLPMFEEQLSEVREESGFGPEDIKSVTLGIAGLSDAVASGQEPGPENTEASFVVRATSAIDKTKLLSAIPNATEATTGDISYIQVPDDPKPPGAIWLADSTTAVVGSEEYILAVAAGASEPPAVDESLLNAETAIRIAFTPNNASAVFRAEPVPDQAPMPPLQPMVDFVKVVQPTISAAGIGIDLSKDITISGAIKTDNPSSATAVSTALTKLMDDMKAMAENPPPGMSMGFAPPPGSGEMPPLEVSTADTTTMFSITQVGAGEQLAAAAPMIPLMVQGAMGGMGGPGGGMMGGPGGGMMGGPGGGMAGPPPADQSLRRVGLALMNFQSAWGRLPNAASKDPSGNRLLSWRVHVLEFLGPQEHALYKQFNLEEPWDGPTNRPLLDQIPDAFRSSEPGVDPAKTLIQVVVGPNSVFEGDTGRGLNEILDGTSNTIMFVEVSPDRAVNWTEPTDFEFNPTAPADGLGVEPGIFKAGFVDGSVKTIDGTLDAEILAAMFSRNLGDFVPPDAVQGVQDDDAEGFGPPGGGFGSVPDGPPQ